MLRCIEGFNEGQSYAIESVKSSLTATTKINLISPSQSGVQKNSYRLGYKMEDDVFKYFGPKLTVEITIASKNDIDSYGIRLNSKNHI